MNNISEMVVLFEDDYRQVELTDGRITAPLGTLLDWERTHWHLLGNGDDLSCFRQVDDVITESGLLDEEVDTWLTIEDVEGIKRVLAAEQARREERCARREAAAERKRAKARARYAAKKAAA